MYYLMKKYSGMRCGPCAEPALVTEAKHEHLEGIVARATAAIERGCPANELFILKEIPCEISVTVTATEGE